MYVLLNFIFIYKSYSAFFNRVKILIKFSLKNT